MLIIEVCVGSSCYLRGAPEVIASLQKLIVEHAPGRIEIKGTFCQHCRRSPNNLTGLQRLNQNYRGQDQPSFGL